MVRGEGPSDGSKVVEVGAEERLVGDLGLRDGVEICDDGLNGAGGDAAHDLAGLVADALGKVRLAAASALNEKSAVLQTHSSDN